MIDWTTTAFVFPGQGSQEVGMGADLVSHYPEAEATFALADKLLGYSLSTLCFEGPAEDLTDTQNTQPALYVMGIAIMRVLQAAFDNDLRPAFVAGHSLGELTALTAAGALSFPDGLRLVYERGRLMKEAARRAPGSMAAVLGLDVVDLEAVCATASAQTGQPLVVANDNCPGQLVISGGVDAVNHALPLATERGAKRVVPLAVSVASHSPLMAAISGEFQQALDATAFTAPAIPIVGNVRAGLLRTADEIRAELGAQLTSTVRWTESVEFMRQAGINTIVELGPKDVLTGLAKRIDRGMQRFNLNSADSLAAFLNEHA